MSTPKGKVSIPRWVFLLVPLVAIAIAFGAMSYIQPAHAAEVTAVKSEPPVYPEIPQPDESKGMLDKLKAWFEHKKDEVLDDEGEVNHNEKDVVKKPHQTIPTEEAKSLESVFNTNSEKVTKGIKDKAEFDSKQVNCLIKAIVFEAGGEPILGQEWVYDVIRNRMLEGYRDKHTMCDVIFDNKQFSFANIDPDRVPTYSADLVAVTNLVHDMYYDANHKDITCGADHYLRKDIMWDVEWSRQALNHKSPEGLVLKAIVGNHAFFGPEGCNRETKTEE